MEIAIDGMNCQSCARKAAEALQALPGVERATISLEPGRAVVVWKPSARPDETALFAAVRQAGFGPRALASTPVAASPLSGWKFNVVLGAVFTVPLMAGEWVFPWGRERWFQWLSLCLALPVQILAGARFYRGAWAQLKAGQSTMDTLVALGSTTAFGYSCVGLLTGHGGHLYFMEAAAIITFISAGHWLESLATARAGRSLRALMDLTPPKARTLRPDGTENEVDVATLAPGDLIVLRPGDRVPIDGLVEEGTSSVDEAMLTGESMPVQKAPGATVYGGTLNGQGRLIIRANRTGAETALAHIIEAVQRAQSSRASIQRLADRISNVFVPGVILVALGTALFWGLAYPAAAALHQWLGQFMWTTHPPDGRVAAAIVHAAAVLIVACPCALGLATPAAIMAAANVASRRGILIRDGLALEKSGQITTVLFDKTGTLTHGSPVLVEQRDHRPPTDCSVPLLALAAALARSSSHPLSRALVTEADRQSPRLGSWPETPSEGQWSEIPGRGMEWRPPDASEHHVRRLGSFDWLRACGVGIPLDEPAQPRDLPSPTTVGLAEGNRLLGTFAFQDTLKPGARGVIARLLRDGIRVGLVSGDVPSVAAAAASYVGIPPDGVFAQVRPEDKAGLVRRLQSEGQRVAFVGDGINDAPALEQADLGVAVAKASDVARESADLVLLRSDLEAVPEAMGLAQAALRTIHQNLFWAFFYNAAAIPLAALGFLSPVVCALAMGISDVVVIGNALRLGRWRLKHFVRDAKSP